jgi:hypothetical protein
MFFQTASLEAHAAPCVAQLAFVIVSPLEHQRRR